MPKILIIDDDKTMVYLLKTLLEMDGFEVVEVRDWKAILKTVSIEKPDIISFQIPMGLIFYLRSKLNQIWLVRES